MMINLSLFLLALIIIIGFIFGISILRTQFQIARSGRTSIEIIQDFSRVCDDILMECHESIVKSHMESTSDSHLKKHLALKLDRLSSSAGSFAEKLRQTANKEEEIA